MCYWLKKKGARQITGCSLLLKIPLLLTAGESSIIEHIVYLCS